VGCVGIGRYITPRKRAKPGDVILLTEGAGGGTIVTTAIYYGMHEIVEETLNIDFITACKSIFDAGIVKEIHSMSDVTNGGIRGDAEEISRVSCTSLIFDAEKVSSIVNKRVLDMLDELEIDFMGLSIDSLMVICPPDIAVKVKKAVRSAGIKIEEVGWVEEGEGAYLLENGSKKSIKPRFREAAYTPLKKVVGEKEPANFEEMKKKVDEAVLKAIEKKRKIIERIKGKITHG
jgi:hydrogenase expression/formation protein